MRFGFSQSLRLLKKTEFFRIKKNGTSFTGHVVVFSVLNEKLKHPRLGITVSKQFGKAHDRNRFKRVIREAFRLSQHTLPPLSIHIGPKRLLSAKWLIMPSVQEVITDFSAIFL